jgi:hypothetical protein
MAPGPHVSASGEVLGPACIEQLNAWDLRLVEQLRSGHGWDRLTNLLKAGGLFTSSYSGWDAPREGWRVFEERLNSIRGDLGLRPSAKTMWVSSCDVGQLQRDVLMKMSSLEGHRPCVFVDILNMIDPTADRFIRSLLPNPADSAKDKLDAHDQMHQFLRKNSKWAFGPHVTGWCCVHEQDCPVWPLPVWRAAKQHASIVSDGPEWKKQRLDRMPWYIDPHCVSLGVSDDDVDAEFLEPFVVDMSCPCCQDWSAQGCSAGDIGRTEPPHIVYINKRRAAAELELENAFVFECTPRYPVAERQAVELADTHEVLSVLWSPHDAGYPVRRPRLFSAGIARWSHIWVGPTGPELQADFCKQFGASLVLDGDCFFQASDEDRHLHIKTLAASRNTRLPPDWQSMALEDLVPYIGPPGQASRAAEWQLRHAAWDLEAGHAHGSAFLCDLDHHPGHGPMPGKLYPTFLTHHNIYSWSRGQLATESESWSALGLDVRDHAGKGRPISPVFKIMSGLKVGQQQLLRGNSMHIPSISMWLVYVLSHCVRRSDLQMLPVHIGSPGIEEENFDELD